MKITCLNVKYISGKPHQYFEDFKEPMPSTRAIAWCMARTEVARLFSMDDMHEFLFRLPILFHIRGLVEDWLMDGTLFNYWFRGREYTLTIDDLAMHCGLEAYDHYLDVTPRDRYMNRVKWSMNFPLMAGYADDFPQLRIDGTRLIVDHLVYGPELTLELTGKAAFFAGDVMKFMPPGLFRDAGRTLRRKKKELARRREMIDALHDFDLSNIPGEILSACMDKVWKGGGPREKILENPGKADSIDRQLRPMIFLAWMWASHFTTDEGRPRAGKEEFTSDYLDYETEDGGYNLKFNIDMQQIEEMVPLFRPLKDRKSDSDRFINEKMHDLP